MIEFGSPEDMAWRDEAACFFVRSQGKKILCRISAEAIDDHLGDPHPTDDNARLSTAKKHFDQLTDMAGHKIANRAFEPDGTILIRTADF